MIGFQSDSVAVTERDGVAILTVAVISKNISHDALVKFTTSSGTATGEIRGRKESVISSGHAVYGAHHYILSCPFRNFSLVAYESITSHIIGPLD